MKIGISTACLYPEYLEKSLQWVVENGIPYTELFINTCSEMSGPFIREYQAILSGSSTKILAIHPWTSGIEPFLFFTNYERRFLDGMELYKRYFDIANQLGASVLVIHGDRKDSHFDSNMYFERFARLRESGKQAGIIVAQENVSRCRSGHPQFIKEMKSYLHGNVDFVLDLKQTIRFGSDPFEMAEIMGENICHIHASDSNKEYDCLAPGKGSFDFYRFFDLLQSFHYAEGFLIELYNKNYKSRKDLIEAMEYLKDYRNQQI